MAPAYAVERIQGAVHDLRCCLADNYKTHDDRLLCAFVIHELVSTHAFNEFARIRRCLAHVFKIIRQT